MSTDPFQQKIEAGIALAERFPEKFQPVILAEILRSSLNGSLSDSSKRVRRVRREGKDSDASSRQTLDGPRQQLLGLKGEGFFRTPKDSLEVLKELKTRGFHYPTASVRARLLELARNKQLRRVHEASEGKQVYQYTNPTPQTAGN